MKPWQVIFRKEFFEVFRDGRTRFNVILSPLLITPIVLSAILSMGVRQQEKSRKESVTVAVVGLDKAPSIKTLLSDSQKDGSPVTITEMTQDVAEQAIRERTVRAAALLPDDAEAAMKEMRPVHLTILLDEGNQSSQEAAGRLESFFESRGRQVTAKRLWDQGLSQQMVMPFTTHQKPIAGGTNRGTLLLAIMLPYMLSLWAIMGGIYIANDTVAGEKERGTLETLLVSPVPRRQIVLGKFVAVASVAMVSSIMAIIGFLWPFYVKLPMFDALSKAGVTIQPATIVAMLLVQVPLAVFGAGMLLSISTFARNQKEAQTFLGPALLAVTVAAVMSTMLKSDAGMIWALVPITNAALVLKQALENAINPTFVAAACAASLLYAAAAVFFATRLFQKESILLKA